MAKRITILLLVFALIFAVALSGCTARRPMTTDYNDNNGNINDLGYNGNGYDYGYGRNGYNVGYYSDRDDFGFDNNAVNPRMSVRKGNDFGYRNNRNNLGFPTLPNNIGNRTGNGNVVGNGNAVNDGRMLGTQNTTNTAALERQCEAVRGVEDAQVVVTGNTAYCGIDTNNASAADMTRIRNDVAERIRGMNPDINTVYVSTEQGFMDRIRRVGDGLRNGRTIDGFTNQLNDMVRTITPVRW